VCSEMAGESSGIRSKIQNQEKKQEYDWRAI
jgi:hypothetical protein